MNSNASWKKHIIELLRVFFFGARPLTAEQLATNLALPSAEVKTASQLRREADEAEKERLGEERHTRLTDNRRRIGAALERRRMV